ncbi:TlpA family protein disulfide reductase [Chryseobacterium sp. SSA4.19]|uniref:TlpA family protein disulfide reductase n=1 Tax=Chryseobacterium sp. SSA4.19 TaxID=2919915 RepID=UPI001F4E4A55|nr:TlpA family protein disulfide reductase [Chryseobacterium sp. SSA4.19]MCJ8155524.1 TlpA family protein disulfide reductase [Chryseobacterium sp. SSA4.19]
MKKIILSTLVVFALTSCKKESEKNNDTVTATDSASTSETPSPAVSLKVLTPDHISKILNNKNDTLYVTNFFATWCGPCVKEIPHFKKKIEELKGKPVKITFVSLDQKDIWNTEVPRFTSEHGIQDYTVLLDGQLMDANFYKNNFKQWDGGAIPFTFMRKGDQTDETLGMISEEQLDEKINKFLNSKGDKKIKLDDDYVAGTIGTPEKM